jgi:hypothetical protein
MRNRIRLLVVALFSLAAGAPLPTARPDIGGVWRETSAKQIANSVVVVSQDGTALTVCSSWELGKEQVVWQGKGTISGRRVSIQYKHTKAPAGWCLEGVQEMELSPDGKTLTGMWKNHDGATGPLRFERVR